VAGEYTFILWNFQS